MEKYQDRTLVTCWKRAFSGCNTVGAFSGKGKIKTLKIMLKYEL